MKQVLFWVVAVVMMAWPLCAQQCQPETSTPSATLSDKATHIDSHVTPPVLVYQIDPAFSKEARKKGISGHVRVYAIIGEDGLTQKVHVVEGLGYGLDEAAVEAVQKYRFKPAKKDGVPVAVDIYIDVNFQLVQRKSSW